MPRTIVSASASRGAENARNIQAYQHQIEPAILYFGTPVVLIGSTNEDGSFNLAPMSSAWWVGWRCMLGLARNSKTTENMIRQANACSTCRRPTLVGAVDRLARTTGSDPVPPGKIDARLPA